MRKLALLLALAIATPLAAQIADNSFLIEEAYNQEPGVVQHISLFQHDTRGGGWSSSFTQEWPLSGIRHQLSYTATALRVDGSGLGFGDFAINYRYQLFGDGESRIAFSPRLTVILPAGDEQQGRGAGATGIQVMLPLSTVLSPHFVAHWNLGATATPARDSGSWTAGQSVVWLAQKHFNTLVETLWTRNDFRGGSRETSLVVSPGIRWSYDLANGLEIVPGLAVPFSLRGEDSRSVLVYLSFEHPFRRNR